ncbi:MAG TPA: O-antigen ligase family protein, partial [Solirubrobacteraceae bacterium]|nr:O-antigen ligase family protein [Solirubrobacteraceae bacterium]
MSTPTIPIEHRPALGAAPPLASAPRRGGERPLPSRLLRADALWWPTLLTAGFACSVTFLAKGGLNLESMTTTEMALTLAGGLAAAVAVLFTPAARSLLRGRKYGLWPVGLLLGFTVLSALSVVWSVQPDAAFKDALRLLAYSAVFGAAVALVRLAPERWSAILGGLALAAVVVCGYALATKIFPGKLAPLATYARLQEPYGYWNAIGLSAAMGAICCMWLGARRAGHALLSALAYPAMGVLLVTLMLAYSRGALVALAIGLALWFCIVPLRLRGAAVLIVAALGAGAVVAWDFSKHALTTDAVPLGERATAGHQLGALLVVMVLALTLAGIAIGFLTGRRPPSRAARRRAGAALFALIALAVGAFALALAHSHRGLTGSVSHAVGALTNPNAKPPANSPGRLTAVASVRARYWKEALQVFGAHPALGAGAGGYETARLRYRTAATLEVKHAHGFVVQTLADLGAAGLALALALLLAWMAAAGRPTHPFNRRWTGWRTLRRYLSRPSEATAPIDIRAGGRPGWRRAPQPYTPERIGMLCMLCLVVVFGVHSFVDWTWYVPGNACVALLCAGWLAGRGPLSLGADDSAVTREWPSPEPSERRPLTLRPPDPIRIGVAAAIVIAALLAAWSQWQPQRSVDASQEALALLARDPRGALAKAHTALARDPLSSQALFTLAAVQQATGQSAQAKATLQRAVHRQPSNPETWVRLGEYDLSADPRGALNELRAAIYLNPESIAPEAIAYGNPEAIAIQNDYIRALRATGATSASVGGTAPGASGAGRTSSTGRSARAPGAGSAPGRARGGAGLGAGARLGRGAPTSAIARLRRAEAAARRAARRRGAPPLPGIRKPRAGP